MASQDDDGGAQKRRDAMALEEEEAWRADDEYRQQQADEEAANRQSAIDQMVGWFGEQFEDPQNETPYDSEDGNYVYVFGGPFDASEVLGDQFGSDHKQEWIEAAVEEIQTDGTYEWAPSSNGDYYEHPDDDDASEAASTPGSPELRGQILDRLDALEAQLASLSDGPPPIGHNQPPGDAGLPYDEPSRQELQNAIVVTRNELNAEDPDAAQLAKTESTFKRIGTAIAAWVGKKLDVAVDESIKAGIKLIIWSEVAKLAISLAHDIRTYLIN